MKKTGLFTAMVALLIGLSGCAGGGGDGGVSNITVDISPKNASVTQGFTVQFSAMVGGASNTAVNWSVEGGAGTISSSGLFTAPQTPGSYSVVATTQAQPAVSARVTVAVVASSAYLTPGAVTGDVVVAMDTRQTLAISPLVYGVNLGELSGSNFDSYWGSYLPKFTLNRYGGNNTTPLNWETGNTNAGNDWLYENYDYALKTANPSGVAMTAGLGNAQTPRVDFSHARNAAQIVSVPMIGYVAKDASGAQPIPAAADATTPATPNPAHWVQALAANPAGATVMPDTTDNFVYTDDFVKWMEARYPNVRTDAAKTILYELDNEPDLWGGTHQQIRGAFNGSQIPTGYDELVNKSVAHATAIKSVAPGAVVIGGAFAGFDALTLLHWSPGKVPPTGYTYYFDYYLEKMKQASDAAGKRLIDVFDMHWYVQSDTIINDNLAQNDASNPVNEREQVTRSLWDPYYIENNSWVTISIPAGDRANCKPGSQPYTQDCPIALIPRMQNRINTFYPGTKIAIGEYWYGRGGDISATIANADVLGIFGKYGVYAASMWPNATRDGNGNRVTYDAPNNCNGDKTCILTHTYQCALRAIDIYRNYDGSGARFGDTYVGTSVADATFTSPATQNERLTAYASMDAGNPDRVVMVAINKASSALNAGLKITHTKAFGTAEVWQVTGTNGGAGGCTAPVRKADISLPLTNAFNATVPAQSVTVFVLK